MRRRDFIPLVASLAAWPRLAAAQARRPRVAILDIASPEFSAQAIAAFRDGLRRLGYIENQTIDFDYRTARGDTGSLPRLAAELLASRPDVALATSISSVRAIRSAAPNLPVVCSAFGDEFIPGLAASFAHPGGSVTGVASLVEGMVAKQVELSHDAVPGARKIGLLANPEGASFALFERQTRAGAEALGLETMMEKVTKENEIDAALGRVAEARVQVVIVQGNGLFNISMSKIVDRARELRLALISTDRRGVDAGGLASYGINAVENCRRCATFVHKILKGEKPGDLPIEIPTRFELVLNLKTARSIGIEIPPTLIVRADEVIE